MLIFYQLVPGRGQSDRSMKSRPGCERAVIVTKSVVLWCRRRSGRDHADLWQRQGDVRLLQPEGAHLRSATIHPHQLGESPGQGGDKGGRGGVWRNAKHPGEHAHTHQHTHTHWTVLKGIKGEYQSHEGSQHIYNSAVYLTRTLLVRDVQDLKPGGVFVVQSQSCSVSKKSNRSTVQSCRCTLSVRFIRYTCTI